MSDLNSSGGLRISGIQMKQLNKKYFDTYSDAEIWMLNSGMNTDQTIHKEAGKYFIFTEEKEKTNG